MDLRRARRMTFADICMTFADPSVTTGLGPTTTLVDHCRPRARSRV